MSGEDVAGIPWEEILGIWGDPTEGSPVRRVERFLFQRLGLKARDCKGRMLLYGRTPRSEFDERVVGTLIGVAQGLVLFDAGYRERELPGIIEPCSLPGILYTSRPFAMDHVSASLSIYPASEDSKRYFPNCPAQVCALFPRTQLDRYGINQHRWATLEGWLRSMFPSAQ